MYRSPIDMMMTDIRHQIEKQQDEEIYKAVVSVGINVDKEELIRALRYDRQQYEKGFLDGQAAAVSAMVRCEGCRTGEPCEVKGKVWCKKMGRYMKEDGFCSEGERRADG